MADKEWKNRTNLDLITRKRRFYKTLQSRGWEFDLINRFMSKIN